MRKYEKILEKFLLGRSDRNIAFNDLRFFLQKLGFEERIRGDHYIFTMEGLEEIINRQPLGKNVKA